MESLRIPSKEALASFSNFPGARGILTCHFPPDGQFVYARDVRLGAIWGWNLSTWKNTLAKTMSCFAVSSNGLVALGYGFSVYLFDGSGNTVGTVDLQGKSPKGIVLSPDGKTFATWSDEGEPVEEWNAQTGARIATYAGHASPVQYAYYVAGDALLTIAYRYTDSWKVEAGEARLWDRNAKELIYAFPAKEDLAWDLSPDKKRLAITSGSETVLWDLSAAMELDRVSVKGDYFSARFIGSDCLCLRFDTEETQAVLWNLKRRAAVKQWGPVFAADVVGGRFLSITRADDYDMEEVLLCNADGSVVHSVVTGQDGFERPSGYTQLLWSDANQLLILGYPEAHRLRKPGLYVWDAAYGEMAALGDTDRDVRDMKISPDGHILAATHGEGPEASFAVWNLQAIKSELTRRYEEIVMSQRKAKALCVYCGEALGALDKLRGLSAHKRCEVFRR